MYRDQHNVTSLGTSRLLTRNAPAYEEYLNAVLGRPFVLANPVETHGPMRVKARFVTDKAASGEKDGPFIELWIDYNPGMGLYTVKGEYFVPPNLDEPLYASSPRSGFDDELLADPFRLFDWLRAVTSGQPVYYEDVMRSLAGLMTPAGTLEGVDIQTEEASGMEIAVLKMAPEFRIPRDYYVSGTMFPGPTGGLTRQADLGHIWQVDYQMPIQNAVQGTLDRLYGDGAFDVEVDTEGFVFVTALEPIPSQDGRTHPNLPPKQESREWYTDAILRMAGVGGHDRLGQNRLQEKYEGGAPIILKKPKDEPKATPKQSNAWHNTGIILDPKKPKGKPKLNTAPPSKKSPQSHKDLWMKLLAQTGSEEDAGRLLGYIMLRLGGLRGKKKGATKEEGISDRMRDLLSEEEEPLSNRALRILAQRTRKS